jgi:hypothetical protein
MVLGFNHNIQYRGEIFHVQTEDSGVDTPQITTLLYLGGVIISSIKTSYADIIKVDNLEKVVEELMKEQHKDMLRRLKAGEFDERAFGQSGGTVPPDTESEPIEAVQPVPPEIPSADPADGNTKKPKSLDEIILDYLITGDSE